MELTPKLLEKFANPTTKNQTKRRKALVKYFNSWKGNLFNHKGLFIFYTELNIEEAIILNKVFNCTFIRSNIYPNVCKIKMNKEKWNEFINIYVDYSKPDFQL